MRFRCGPSYQEKFQARQQWHRWFAWYPVRVASGHCRWLETVERRGHTSYAFDGAFGDFDYEYRACVSD